MDKQIEEMARILCPCSKSSCDSCIQNGVECIGYREARAFYNAGYRKIPENAVIINKDENPCLSCPVPEDVQRDVDCSTICGAVRLGIDWQNQCKVLVKESKQIIKELKQARKETAEKFAEEAKKEAFVSFMGEPIIRASKIDEICKEFTEGRDEKG